jgi:hypothetical protein
MDQRSIVQLTSYVEPVFCVAALAAISRRGQLRRFPLLSIFLAVRVLSFMVLEPILYFVDHGITTVVGYRVYFYVYWTTYTIEAVLMLGLVFQLFRLTIAPLRGLARLGQLIFGLIAVVGLIAASGTLFVPGVTLTRFIVRSATDLQQMQSILTVCLLVVTAFLILPMRLELRRREIGISLGMAIFAISDLAASWYMGTFKNLNSFAIIISSLAALTGISVWVAYFMLSEPQPRALVLPQDSRLMRWNRFWLARIGGQPA